VLCELIFKNLGAYGGPFVGGWLLGVVMRVSGRLRGLRLPGRGVPTGDAAPGTSPEVKTFVDPTPEDEFVVPTPEEERLDDRRLLQRGLKRTADGRYRWARVDEIPTVSGGSDASEKGGQGGGGDKADRSRVRATEAQQKWREDNQEYRSARDKLEYLRSTIMQPRTPAQRAAAEARFQALLQVVRDGAAREEAELPRNAWRRGKWKTMLEDFLTWAPDAKYPLEAPPTEEAAPLTPEKDYTSKANRVAKAKLAVQVAVTPAEKAAAEAKLKEALEAREAARLRLGEARDSEREGARTPEEQAARRAGNAAKALSKRVKHAEWAVQAARTPGEQAKAEAELEAAREELKRALETAREAREARDATRTPEQRAALHAHATAMRHAREAALRARLTPEELAALRDKKVRYLRDWHEQRRTGLAKQSSAEKELIAELYREATREDAATQAKPATEAKPASSGQGGPPDRQGDASALDIQLARLRKLYEQITGSSNSEDILRSYREAREKAERAHWTGSKDTRPTQQADRLRDDLEELANAEGDADDADTDDADVDYYGIAYDELNALDDIIRDSLLEDEGSKFREELEAARQAAQDRQEVRRLSELIRELEKAMARARARLEKARQKALRPRGKKPPEDDGGDGGDGGPPAPDDQPGGGPKGQSGRSGDRATAPALGPGGAPDPHAHWIAQMPDAGRAALVWPARA
jgi:hypothetical protein